jgi:hypothetical protein
MSDHAYANWISQIDLQSLIAMPPGSLKHMILEAVDEVKFAPFSGDIDLERYNTGRVFGPSCEIRWQRDGERFHTMIVGDISQPPAFITVHNKALPEAAFDYKPDEYYLWGEWSKELPQWIEASIPHVFDYPEPAATGKFRYKLLTIEYINRDSGEVEFYRFSGARQEKL